MKKHIIAAVTLPLATAWVPIVMSTAPSAHAGPCTPPVSDAQFCQNCLIATAPTGQQAGCTNGPAYVAAKPGSTGYPDCDKYQIYTDRSTCVDQHLAGLR